MAKSKMSSVACYALHDRLLLKQTYETGVGALREKIWQYFQATDFASNVTARRLSSELRDWALKHGYSQEDFGIAKAEVSRQYKEPTMIARIKELRR